MSRLIEIRARFSRMKFDGVESRNLPTVTGLMARNTDPEKLSSAMIRLLSVTRSSTSEIIIGNALLKPNLRVEWCEFFWLVLICLPSSN